MANEPNESNEPEVIRHQMEETRASLTEKLETLEQQVVETVEGATTAVSETVESVKEAVQGTVDTVKDTVQGTVETVRETFDLQRQVDRRPWLMVGGSFALGYLAGYLLPKTKWERSGFGFRHEAWAAPRSDGGMRGYTPAEAAAPPRAGAEQPGWLSELGQTFSPEINKLKGLAIGTLMGLVRDMIARSAPPNLGPQLTDVMNNITTKLGGQPISEPVLEGSSLARWFRRDEGESRGEPSEGLRPTTGAAYH